MLRLLPLPVYVTFCRVPHVFTARIYHHHVLPHVWLRLPHTPHLFYTFTCVPGSLVRLSSLRLRYVTFVYPRLHTTHTLPRSSCSRWLRYDFTFTFMLHSPYVTFDDVWFVYVYLHYRVYYHGWLVGLVPFYVCVTLPLCQLLHTVGYFCLFGLFPTTLFTFIVIRSHLVGLVGWFGWFGLVPLPGLRFVFDFTLPHPFTFTIFPHSTPLLCGWFQFYPTLIYSSPVYLLVPRWFGLCCCLAVRCSHLIPHVVVPTVTVPLHPAYLLRRSLPLHTHYVRLLVATPFVGWFTPVLLHLFGFPTFDLPHTPHLRITFVAFVCWLGFSSPVAFLRYYHYTHITVWVPFTTFCYVHGTDLPRFC